MTNFSTIYTNITHINTRYKLYSDSSLLNLAYTTIDLNANADYNFTNEVPAGIYYVTGQHKITRPTTYNVEMPEYINETAPQQITIIPFVDRIVASLSTSLATYNASASNSWVAITAAEYALLASNVTSTTRFGTAEASMLTGTSGNFGGTAITTFGQDMNPALNGYVYAFKVASMTAITLAGQSVVRISTNGLNTFTTLGSILPAGTVLNSQQHFVLKNPVVRYVKAYLGVSLKDSNSIYYQATGTSGKYLQGSLENPTLTGYGWSMQALSTSLKQWSSV